MRSTEAGSTSGVQGCHQSTPPTAAICFVRGRQDNRIVLTTYGRSSGFCIDPIEKKPLKHYLPGTPVLSFGTAGCNLTCKFCQNWDISKAREMDRLMDAASPDEIVDAAIAGGARSIAYTYNDPVIFLEYAVDVGAVVNDLQRLLHEGSDEEDAGELIGPPHHLLDARGLDPEIVDHPLCGLGLPYAHHTIKNTDWGEGAAVFLSHV